MPDETQVAAALRMLAEQQRAQQPPLAFLQAPLEGGIQGLLGLLGLGNDASQPNRFGQMLAAGLPLAAGAKGLKAAAAASAAERAGTEATQGIRAYHGSPHDFEKFELSPRTSHTGEGAQAYGHGLYFADREGTAKAYRDALAPQGVLVDGQPFRALNSESPIDMAIADLSKGRENIEAVRRGFLPQFAAEYEQAVDKYRGRVTPANPGKVYEVNIKAHPDQMLDWDKPVGQQSPQIQDALGGLQPVSPADGVHFTGGGVLRVVEDPDFGKRYFMEIGGSRYRLSESDVANMLSQGTEGRAGYQALSTKLGGDQAASEFLKSKGIPGLKFLDQGSRAAGQGTSNYVVFNDNLIDILRKYGVAIAASLGAGSQMGQEQQ